jgi:DHA2 family multidrug resistance protein
MDFNYARDQLILANVVRALGQPFTIVPVIGLATAALSPKQAGDGSAIFNILRNLGGSVGIAILSTLVTRREQFHDFRIGESVTPFGLAMQQRLAAAQASFMTKGTDAVTALQQATDAVKEIVRREANIMAFNDAFLIVGLSLAGGALLVWFCQKPRGGPAPAH